MPNAPSRIAVAMFAIAWFVPVIAGGSTLADGQLPGLEALLIALGPLKDREFNGGFLVPALSVLSGLSNLVFVASVWIMARRPARARRTALPLAVAALVNTMWLFQADLTELRVGYYLWFGAFVLFALAAWRHRPAVRAGDPVAPHG